MLPDEAEAWLQEQAVKRELTVLADPSLEWRRFLHPLVDGPPPASRLRPDQDGIMMFDLPQMTAEALLLGAFGFKAKAQHPAEAQRARRLTEALRRAMRRTCTQPLYVRSTTTGATSPSPACWATPAAVAAGAEGMVIKQPGVAFTEFAPDGLDRGL